MTQCDQRIEQVLAQLPTAKPVQTPVSPKPVAQCRPQRALRKRTQHGPNAATVDFSAALTQICGVDLIKVCGLNLLSVLMLIREIGSDRSRAC